MKNIVCIPFTYLDNGQRFDGMLSTHQFDGKLFANLLKAGDKATLRMMWVDGCQRGTNIDRVFVDVDDFTTTLFFTTVDLDRDSSQIHAWVKEEMQNWKLEIT